MIRFAVRALLARKLRTILTAFAIVLGVGMVTGTFVLTDSISKAFDSIFSQSYKNTDAVITGKNAVGQGDQVVQSLAFDAGVIEKVAALPEVAATAPIINGEAQLIGRDGKAIVFGGAPNIAFNVNPQTPQFQTLTLTSGSWPNAGQVVIDASTAQKKKFRVGDHIGVQARGPVVQFTISGIVKFGAVDTIGGATLAGFTTPDAQKLFEKQGKLDQILVSAKPGVSPARLRAALLPVIPANTEVRTGEEQAAEDAKQVNDFLNIFRILLLVFAGIALFVGAFVIFNSLSITIAQRTREFATLRTLGASRRQVLGAVIVEGLGMGVVASVLGLVLGLLLAVGLFNLFEAIGLTLPNNGLLFRPRTAIVGLLVGVLVTVGASLSPARRATRVPPIAAVREGSVLPKGRLAPYRTQIALGFLVIGFVLLGFGLFKKGLDTGLLLTLIGIGALIIFVSVAIFSSHLVRPLATAANPIARWATIAFLVIAWPFFTFPYWALRKAVWGPGKPAARLGLGAIGLLLGFGPVALIVLIMALRRALTRWRPEWPMEFPTVVTDKPATAIGAENSRRDTQRTAVTAAALMIGLALVTLVSSLAAGIIRQFEKAVDDIFTADYAIVAQNNFSPLPTNVAAAATKAPGVEAIAGVRGGDARAFGKTVFITGLEPQAPSVLTLRWKNGDQQVLGSLGEDGALVDNKYAKSHDLTIGSPVQIQVPTGEKYSFKVNGIFVPPDGGSPFGPITISAATFDKAYQQPQNLYAFVKMAGGDSPANTKALEDATKGFPNAKVQTRQQFKDSQIGGIKGLLNVLYVLLALSVVVSIFGIVNTLILTVFERTRELGMMRAIGMTRRQTRRMIRHESVVIALIGAALGIVVGLVFAGLLTARVKEIAFVVPWSQLIMFAIVAVLVGIFAAIFPARRAAKLNPLEALQYE